MKLAYKCGTLLNSLLKCLKFYINITSKIIKRYSHAPTYNHPNLVKSESSILKASFNASLSKIVLTAIMIITAIY